jgi:hypothetical protein
MQRDGHEFHSIIFLRNDVYDKLTRRTPDRGKDQRVTLDWSDSGLLRRLIERRLIHSGLPDQGSFDATWAAVCDRLCHGRDSMQYLIDMSLMRPRYLLILIGHCRGMAVNYSHTRIQEADIDRGMVAYSNDLIVDTDNEIKDVFPEAENLIYRFHGEECDMLEEDLHNLFRKASVTREEFGFATDLLLWYGVLGIFRSDGRTTYIFDSGYDMTKLKTIREKESGGVPIYRIHPAFWPGLEIKVPRSGADQTSLPFAGTSA